MEVDAAPHIFEDSVGLMLAGPEDGWQNRPDMSAFTRPFRASIVARARFVEDLVEAHIRGGITQYVILGAGLDTFAQRKPQLCASLQVFEIDQPQQQAWKRQRLVDLDFGIPPFLHLVPVDFEAQESWWDKLCAAHFKPELPAIVASTGVSMYLSKEAVAATLRQLAALKSGSTFAMTFMLPIELTDPEIRFGVEKAAQGAKASGTPWLSFFTPDEILSMARDAGFRKVEHVSALALAQRYFQNRTDGLRPPRDSEEFLVAAV
jgi:methyltransferase (TIGR00027 family)